MLTQAANVIVHVTRLFGPRTTPLGLIGLGFDRKFDGMGYDIPNDKICDVHAVRPQAGRVALAKFLLGRQGTALIKPDTLPVRMLPHINLYPWMEPAEEKLARSHRVGVLMACNRDYYAPGLLGAVRAKIDQWRGAAVIELLGLN